MTEIIPRSRWERTSWDELVAQPGHRLEIKIPSLEIYDLAWEWADANSPSMIFGGYTSGTQLMVFIFTELSEAIIFKLIWGGSHE